MKLLVAPAVEPVSVVEAKRAARVDDLCDFDAQIPGWIKAAREHAEQITGRLFLAQTWRVELRDWPAATDRLAIAEPTAVAVSYWDGSAWQTIAGGTVAFLGEDGATFVAPESGAWPTLGAKVLGARVRVDITAGAPTAAGVDEQVKLFIKALVTHWIDNPGAAPQGGRSDVDPVFARLLDRAKVYA